MLLYNSGINVHDQMESMDFLFYHSQVIKDREKAAQERKMQQQRANRAKVRRV